MGCIEKALVFFFSCKVAEDICNYGNVLWMGFLFGESWNTRLHTLIPAWLEIKIISPTDKLFHHTAVSAGAHFQAIIDSEVHESHFRISFLADVHLVNVGI